MSSLVTTVFDETLQPEQLSESLSPAAKELSELQIWTPLYVITG